jgi:cell division protein FtsL
MVEEDRTNIKRSFIVLTAIFFVILCGFVWVILDIREISAETHKVALESKRLSEENRRLALENKKRDAEIQESRVSSCRQTYSSIRKVFRPFFPPPPRTKEQQDRLDKFNDTINKARKGCIIQTKPKENTR